MDAACEHIDRRLTPFYSQFIREVTKDDILRLMEIKMGRILKFNSDKAEEAIARMNEDIAGSTTTWPISWNIPSNGTGC